VATRRAAVLGSPIAHSQSPALHRAAYRALGLDWTYDAIEVTPDVLADFVAACDSETWAGLSLTMPLKSQVLPLLDRISQTAELAHAANTVIFAEGIRHGHNTDVTGMQKALEEAHGGPLSPRSGLIIGAGATARSALVALAAMGIRRVTVLARRPEAVADLVDLAATLDVAVTTADWDGSDRLEADVVVATVPPGAADALVGRIPSEPGVLLDVAYGDAPTRLVEGWRGSGGEAAEGLDLLLWQAVAQVRLMTGLEPPVDAMRAALNTRAP
jgi:shikimate dehydrogenase